MAVGSLSTKSGMLKKLKRGTQMSDDVTNREIITELREVAVAVATLRTEFNAHRDEIKSDIKELRGGHRETQQSVNDLEELTRERREADLITKLATQKMKWDRIVSVGGKVGMVVVTLLLGWLAHMASLALHLK
jgi:hypothetical protein